MRTKHIDHYYTSLDRMLELFGREARSLPCRAENAETYAAWKTALKDKLSELTGLSVMEKCDLYPKLMDSARPEEGVTREKWIIQTEKDVWMPFYLLKPDTAAARQPCVIATHGHYGGGKYAVSGRADIPAVKEKIDEYHYAYGLAFAKAGYTVFSPDARGFGERRESTKQTDEEHDFLTSTCEQLNHIAICLGRSLTGLWIWDLTRLIDYIESRGDCDPRRIGCAGLSGGGLQSLWLAAMDERVRCAIVSGYFYGYRDALLKLPNCACNYVPGLWKAADMGDIGALIAPRPLMIETGDEDSLNGESGLNNVRTQLDITKGAYTLFGAADRLYHVIRHGGHRWYGDQAESFMDTYLKGSV